jgi:hypothetical protein
MAPVARMMVSIFRNEDKMELLSAKLTVFLSLFAQGVSYAQAPDGTSFEWKHKSSSSVTSPQNMRLQMVETVLREGSPALTVGTFHLHQMGDEAAVNIIKILGMRETITPTGAELATALAIMEKAFEEPTSIARANDRQPRATLFLLQLFEVNNSGSELKDQIGETRERIRTSLQKANIPLGK